MSSVMPVVSALGPPADGVKHCQPNTRIFVNDIAFGAGTLFIANSRIAWVSDAGNQLSFEYKGISIHAVSRDTSKFAHECLYLMVDGNIVDDIRRLLPSREDATPMDEDTAHDDDDSDDEGQVTEVKFVPGDNQQLDVMFAAMSDCQGLHPNSEDDLSDDEEAEEEEAAAEEEEEKLPNGHGIEDEEEEEEEVQERSCPTATEMTSQGLATLRRLEAMLGGSGAAETPGSLENAEEADMDSN